MKQYIDAYIGIIKAALVVVALLGLVAGYMGWHHHVYQQGYGASETVWKGKEAQVSAEVAAKLASDTEVVRLTQKSVDMKFADLRTQNERSIKNGQEQLDILRSHLRDRTVSLSIPTNGANCGVAAAADAGSGNSESRAELSFAAGDFLTSEASRADQAAVMLNECIDKYDAVQDRFNAK